MNSIIRERSGRSSQFTDVLQEIRTIVVPANTDTVSFTGLDGDKDGYYLLRGKIIAGNAGDSILFRPVPGSDANLVSRGLVSTGAAVTPLATANALMVDNGPVNSLSLIWAEMFASKADGISRGGKTSGVRAVGIIDYAYMFNFGWNDNVTNVIQIDVFANGGSGVGIKQNSVITLFKCPAG